MPLVHSVGRSLLGLPPAGHLSALLSSSSTCHPSLLQLSCSSSAVLLLQRCSSALLGSCSSTVRAAGTSAHTGSEGPTSAPALDEAAPNISPAGTAACPAGGASSSGVSSSFSSSRKPAMLLLFPSTAASRAWSAPQHRHVHSSSDPPPGTTAGSRKATVVPVNQPAVSTRAYHRYSTKGSSKRGRGDAAVGTQSGTPRMQRQQRWRPDVLSKGSAVSARGLTRVLQDCQTPEDLLQQLQQHTLQQKGGHLNMFHISTAYHRLGRMCQADATVAGTAAAQQLLQHLDQLLPAAQQQLDTRGLSNIVWACAHATHSAPVRQLLSAFVQHEMLSAANSQDVANILWAVGKLGHQVPQQQLGVLLTAFTAAGVLQRSNPQHIANVLLGMAHMGQQLPDAQLQLLLAELSAKSDQADPQHLSNSMWAVAKLVQQVQQQQFQKLLTAFISKLNRANIQSVSNALWAASEMGQQLSAQQLQLLLATFVRHLHRAVPQDISNTLLACARFRPFPVPLLAGLRQDDRLQQFLAAASLQELANTAWACGLLGHCSAPLLRGLLQQAVKLLQQDNILLTCQSVCTLCWAVAILDLRQSVPEVLQLAKAASRMWEAAVPENLLQLHQVHLWLLDSNPAAAATAAAAAAAAAGDKGLGLLQVLPQQQLDECRKAMQDQVAASAAAAPSSLQREVFAALLKPPGWQVPPQQEVITADGNYSIDIVAVTAAGVRLAVEVDGPHHFVSPGNRVDGPTQYRNRALAARGYKVISIPWWEWRRLKGTEQQQEYLQKKLKGL